MKKIIYTISAVLFLSTSFAVLPPLYQGLREIDAIISDDQIRDYFSSGETILEISKNENGYALISNKQKVQVDIEYLHTEVMGPSKFKLHFQPAEAIE